MSDAAYLLVQELERERDPRLAVIHAHIQECVIKGEAEGNRADSHAWSVNSPAVRKY